MTEIISYFTSENLGFVYSKPKNDFKSEGVHSEKTVFQYGAMSISISVF